MTDTEHLIQQATYAARSYALASFQGHTTCVETTRLLLAILDKLGVERVRPQAVHVRVFNTPAYMAIQQGIPVEEWPDGAYALGTDSPPEVREANPDGWAGHLVVVMKDETGRRIIDASADQFNRHGELSVPGPVVVWIRGPWSPEEPQYRVLADEFTIIEYAPFAQKFAKEYQEFSAWNDDPEGFDAAAAELAEMIKGGWMYAAATS